MVALNWNDFLASPAPKAPVNLYLYICICLFVFVYLYLCICICVPVGIFLKAHLQQEPLSLDPHAPPPAPVPGPQAAPPTWVWKSWCSRIREGLTLPELSISWHCQHWLNPTITHPLIFDINVSRYMLWQKCVNDHFWEWMITVVEWSNLWDKCYLFVDIDHFWALCALFQIWQPISAVDPFLTCYQVVYLKAYLIWAALTIAVFRADRCFHRAVHWGTARPLLSFWKIFYGLILEVWSLGWGVPPEPHPPLAPLTEDPPPAPYPPDTVTWIFKIDKSRNVYQL